MSAQLEEQYSELRSAAFAIAYRMLGSVVEAEDVAQESLLRIHGVLEKGERIESPRAYVATVATRLAIDELRSAKARRESYTGEWLPEPLLTGSEDDPARRAETVDSVSMAFLVLLESLTPEQRAAFLLHDVFGYGYDEVARIVGKSESNARQLVSRARRYVRERRPRFEASRERRDQLARRFFAAVTDGDLGALEALLAQDVVLYGDGGGKAPALARPLRGRGPVARALIGWGRQRARTPGVSLRQIEMNGQPAALVTDAEGRPIIVTVLDIAGGQVTGVRSILNPDKLRHLGPVGDVRAFLTYRGG